MGELRKDNRLGRGGKVNLTWADEHGHPYASNGECVDISIKGIKVMVDSEIPTRTVVTLKSPQLVLHGSASVRSCTRIGARYVMGLEFVGGMKWQIPADDPDDSRLAG